MWGDVHDKIESYDRYNATAISFGFASNMNEASEGVFPMQAVLSRSLKSPSEVEVWGRNHLALSLSQSALGLQLVSSSYLSKFLCLNISLAARLSDSL